MAASNIIVRPAPAWLRRLRAIEAPSIAPAHSSYFKLASLKLAPVTMVREVECEGTPPNEALRNCAIC